MLSPKRLVCSEHLHMVHPVPSHPYVLVNRSLLCNCHLESSLTYLLESLGSCSFSDKVSMHFTTNAAFDHYMSQFGFSGSDNAVTPANSLLNKEYVFDIFLNETSPSMLQKNHSWPILSLQPSKTLLKLFQTLQSRSQVSSNSPFFHW